MTETIVVDLDKFYNYCINNFIIGSYFLIS
jgi:hypothetical protein